MDYPLDRVQDRGEGLLFPGRCLRWIGFLIDRCLMRCFSAYGEAFGPGSVQVSDALSLLVKWWEDTQCQRIFDPITAGLFGECNSVSKLKKLVSKLDRDS